MLFVLHVGVAYEVHAIASSGATRPVEPARHAFKTGDRFVVHYRPTLPGRVSVVNVNPRGVESHIDTVEVAAGELATLGPYEFAGAKGEETLRILLQPCDSMALARRTRGLVGAGTTRSAATSPLKLGDCGEARNPRYGAPSVRTRTIRKAPADGTTAFALDPLSREELGSGRLAAREVQIALRHR